MAPEQVAFGVFFSRKCSERKRVGPCLGHGLLLTSTDAAFTAPTATRVCLPAHARARIHRTMTAAVPQEMTGFGFLLVTLLPPVLSCPLLSPV